MSGSDVDTDAFRAPNLEFALPRDRGGELTFSVPDEWDDQIGYQIVVPPAGELSTPAPTGTRQFTARYVPPAGFVGVQTFQYTVTRDGVRSDVATGRIAVYPDVRFEAAPNLGAAQLGIRVSARMTDGVQWPAGELVWRVGEQEFSGPMTTTYERTLRVAAPGQVAVRLFLVMAGMNLRIPAMSENGEVVNLSVVPAVMGRVVDAGGRAMPNRRVRGVGETEDRETVTDENGRYTLMVEPGWSGQVLVDEPGWRFTPDRLPIVELEQNRLNADFVRSSPVEPDAPAVPALHFTTQEEQAIEFTLSQSTQSGSSVDFEIVSLPAHGALLQGTERISRAPHQISAGQSRLRYQPDVDFSGEDSFVYRARVGPAAGEAATIRLTVTPLNDAPRLTRSDGQYLSARPNQVVSFTIAASDPDAIGAELTWTVSTAPAHGAVTISPSASESDQTVQVQFTPEADWTGEDFFVIRCVDGGGAVASVSVPVLYSAASIVAKAGPDRAVAGFQVVELDGSSSLTVANTTFAWRQTSGPTVELIGADTPRPRFRAPPVLNVTPLEFELKLTAGDETSVDAVRISANFGRQALLYSVDAALERFWGARTEFNFGGRMLPGFGSTQSADPEVKFWGDEAGSLSDSPVWDFQAREGLAGALMGYLTAYNVTQNREYLRRAEAVGDALLAVQNELNGGWFQDGAVIDGQYYNVGVWGTWGNRRHVVDTLQGVITLDDATSQSCALALLALYETSQEQRFLNGAKRFGDLLVNLKDVSYQGVFPYRNGGIPQVMPIDRAMLVSVNQNIDPRNPDGPYMAHKTLNDGTTAHALIFLSELHRVTGDSRYADAHRLTVDWLLDRHAEYGYRGWAQQYHWQDDRIAWGRYYEPPAFVTCENDIINALLIARMRETSSQRRTRIETSIQRYLEWLRDDIAPPTGYPNERWRYYNHDASLAPMHAPVFAKDFQAWYGEENADRAGPGQPMRGQWDLIWLQRIFVNGQLDSARCDQHANGSLQLPINVAPAGWQASYETQSAAGAWMTMYNVNGTQRPGMPTAVTVNRVLGLLKRFGEIPGVITDSDADGFDDAVETAAGSDPKDSASIPAGAMRLRL